MTIDGNTIRQPNGLKENYTYIQSTVTSLNGSPQRNKIAKKKYAELTWTDLLPSAFQAILVWADDSTTHAYSNTQSRYTTWAFTGLVTILDQGSYEQGGSYMTDTFTVGIQEV